MFDTQMKSISWFLPFVIGCFVVLVTSQHQAGMVLWLSSGLYITGSALVVWGAVNLFIYLSEHFSDVWRMFFNARYKASINGLAETMTGLSNEALGVLRMFGAPTWMIRPEHPTDNGPDFVLYGTRCRMEFIKHVLDHSDQSLYPQSMFHDKMFKWDPFGQVEDRQQHRDLEAWLYSMSMIQWRSGNQRAYFINGWTPEKIMEYMGIADWQIDDDDDEEVSPTLQLTEMKG